MQSVSKSVKIEYSSNNSGGDWWLSDKDWYDLEKAGWEVKWIRNDPSPLYNGDRFLGALATKAIRNGLSLESAISEWESITGENADDRGCECCGQPHCFIQYNS